LMALFDSTNNLFFFNVTIFTISFFLITSLCFSVRFSTNFDFAFPTLLKVSNGISFFFIFTIFLLFCFDFIFNNNFYFFSQNFQLLFFSVFILILGISYDFQIARNITKFELDFLLVCVILSAICLCFTDDFLLFYIAVEFQSLTFYIIATFNRKSEFSTEAGLKYFIFGAVISCFLLFGLFLIYLDFGLTSFESLFSLALTQQDSFLFSGLLFFLVVLLFKIGAAPFHLWVSDVYDGSMLNITMVFAAAPKIIMFSILVKLVFSSLFNFDFILKSLLLFASLLSITIGTFSAIYQKRIKRLFAYSAISHTGFILLGIMSNSAESSKATIAYILIYSFLTLLLFSLLILVSISTNNNPKYLANWTSFGLNNYLFAISFTLILFSIAGIPPLAGFFSKFFVLLSIVSNGYYLSAFYIIIISSIGCFYYIRLIKMFFFTKFSKNSFWLSNPTKKNTDLILATLMFLNIAFFIRPEFISHISTVVCFSII